MGAPREHVGALAPRRPTRAAQPPPRRSLRVCALVLGLGALAGSAPLCAQEQLSVSEPEGVSARARRILADPTFQRELPSEAERRERAARRARGDATEPRSSRRAPDLGFPAGGDSGALRKLIGWIALGGIAVFVLVRLAAAFGDARARRRADAIAAPHAAREKPSPPPSSSARELLEAGRTAEALHALLVELLRELAPHAPASRTSRELVREIELDEKRRTALASLARTVERGRFAGEALAPSDVVAGFELAAALRGGAATR